jgi:hypothetical protein
VAFVAVLRSPSRTHVHVSVLNSWLGGAKLANIGHRRLVGSRLPDSDAAKRDVEMFISQKDERMSHILTIDPVQLGPIQSSGDRASVVQPMLDLMRQARQRVILRD